VKELAPSGQENESFRALVPGNQLVAAVTEYSTGKFPDAARLPARCSYFGDGLVNPASYWAGWGLDSQDDPAPARRTVALAMQVTADQPASRFADLLTETDTLSRTSCRLNCRWRRRLIDSKD
jgi:hypothetical protein